MEPAMEGFTTFNSIPSWVFLIEHPSDRKVLFDLGVRKDWENLAPKIVKTLKKSGWAITVEKNVVGILKDNGIEAKEIDSIIWSHWHWDHLGDPSTFPSTTEVVVGPGFKEAFLPGSPANLESPVLESDFTGRVVREIKFDGRSGLKVGSFDGFDFFGDGSFYLLDTPGHAIGHLGGLVRTTTNPDTFVLMGGDLCHHGGELRPSKYVQLPPQIAPALLGKVQMSSCPGAIFERIQHHRSRSPSEPFFVPAMGHDIPETIKTINKTQEADGSDNVFFVSAHDDSLLGVVDLFPAYANDWKKKGWARELRWTFLADFKTAILGQSHL